MSEFGSPYFHEWNNPAQDFPHERPIGATDGYVNPYDYTQQEDYYAAADLASREAEYHRRNADSAGPRPEMDQAASRTPSILSSEERAEIAQLQLERERLLRERGPLQKLDPATPTVSRPKDVFYSSNRSTLGVIEDTLFQKYRIGSGIPRAKLDHQTQCLARYFEERFGTDAQKYLDKWYGELIERFKEATAQRQIDEWNHEQLKNILEAED